MTGRKGLAFMAFLLYMGMNCVDGDIIKMKCDTQLFKIKNALQRAATRAISINLYLNVCKKE